jgi:spore maturation protein B
VREAGRSPPGARRAYPPPPSGRIPPTGGAYPHHVVALLEGVSRWAVPLLMAVVLLAAWLRRVDVYGVFLTGARDGVALSFKILPYVVSIFVALGIFRASGAMDLLTQALRPALQRLGVPGEVLPLMLVRPLSGGGALGITAELLRRWGPDSYIGRLASTMQGSTDTTFYILSVYFGSVGIKKVRHALWLGLLADLTGFAASVFIVRTVFGG